MGLTTLPTVGGDLGAVKRDRALQTPDATRDLAAAQWNAAAAALEAVCEEMGLTDGSTAGSVIARLNAIEGGGGFDIPGLPASAGLAAADLVAVVDDPSGTPATQKATLTQLAALMKTLLSSGASVITSLSGDLAIGGDLIANGGDAFIDALDVSSNANLKLRDHLDALKAQVLWARTGDTLRLQHGSAGARIDVSSTGATTTGTHAVTGTISEGGTSLATKYRSRRMSFGSDITADTATGSLAHDTVYAIDATSADVDVTVNVGTQGDEMQLFVTNADNAVGIVAGTATVYPYGTATLTGLSVGDVITLQWIATDTVLCTIVSVAT